MISFFDDQPAVLTARTMLRALPPTPATGWTPPKYYPDLSRASWIQFDTENKESDFGHGPGWARGKVSIAGVAVTAGWDDGSVFKKYCPCRHEVDGHLNLDATQLFNWLRDSLQRTPHIPKFGANLLYDVGTLTTENIRVAGELYDCQFAEALLDEEGAVNLEYLGMKYRGQGKADAQMNDWLIAAYGLKIKNQREDIYRCSPLLVGPYAEQDATLPREVLQDQWKQLLAEGLLDLYQLESDLINPLVDMRLPGIRVDLDHFEMLSRRLHNELEADCATFYQMTGQTIAHSGPTGDIARAFDRIGIKYRKVYDPRTGVASKPAIEADDLKLIDHPAAKLALKIRQTSKAKGTFIDSYVLEGHVNGRVFPQFHPLRGDSSDGGKFGARSGRFSSSDPNLQNIPVRTELGKEIRQGFVPEVEHEAWLDVDFSQYEYRLLAHAAQGPGADELRADYNNNPETDYHTRTERMVEVNAASRYQAWVASGMTPATIRKRIKTVNFGLMNAMGIDLLCAELSIPKKEGLPLLEAYHAGNPYIKHTIKVMSAAAQQDGFIRTLLGRRSRFNLWEPVYWEKGENRKKALPYHEALAAYGYNIQRARTHIALNRYTQGTNADGMKVSIVRAWKAGVFAITGPPRVTVHDSLGFSKIDSSPRMHDAYRHLKYIMESALALSVPIRVDFEQGPNWGKTEKVGWL